MNDIVKTSRTTWPKCNPLHAEYLKLVSLNFRVLVVVSPPIAQPHTRWSIWVVYVIIWPGIGPSSNQHLFRVGEVYLNFPPTIISVNTMFIVKYYTLLVFRITNSRQHIGPWTAGRKWIIVEIFLGKMISTRIWQSFVFWQRPPLFSLAHKLGCLCIEINLHSEAGIYATRVPLCVIVPSSGTTSVRWGKIKQSQ